MTRTSSWPPIVGWQIAPIKGGWGVSYSTDESEEKKFSVNARGSTPKGVLEIIVQKRIANSLPADIDAVKHFLVDQWYRRDPKRFQRQPAALREKPEIKQAAQEPCCDSEAWVPGAMSMINAFAASGDRNGIASQMATLLLLVKSPCFKCEGCEQFIRIHMSKNRLSNVKSVKACQDWAWNFQEALGQFLDRRIPPREVIEEEFCWT
jgi:hypothetical protein